MTYEEYLDIHGSLTYRFQGVSMMPMLRQDKDIFTVIKKTEERCKKYDVVLYRRGEQYVLHRIVKVQPDGYIILGDNCMYKERNIRDADIIGVLVSFCRNNMTISVNNLWYRFYSRIWYYLYPLRFSLMWLRNKIGKAKQFLKELKQ